MSALAHADADARGPTVGPLGKNLLRRGLLGCAYFMPVRDMVSISNEAVR
ncbi:hypothetical protein AOQ84DRAFT_378981 [Glonium stellatum]|uniref:Uncharacterized protein n=1 Tax=Glonium stellatum TaxID=574774 RepID=A0A8E2EWC9_9PEZI|nr:hypothetical protein AOQ84DRAFT_378981 [Glonium stellatum]